MRCSTAWSAWSATTPVCSLFFLLRALEVRMCRANACCRTTLPVPVFLNRLDAPLWVLSLGMKIFRETKILPQFGPWLPSRIVRAELFGPWSGGTIKHRDAIAYRGTRGSADRRPVCAGGLHTRSVGPIPGRSAPGIDAWEQAACPRYDTSATAARQRSEHHAPPNLGGHKRCRTLPDRVG